LLGKGETMSKIFNNEDSVFLAALQFLRAGVAVFPCKPGTKAPATAKGFKDASTNIADIIDHFADGEMIRDTHVDESGALVEARFARRQRMNLGVVPGPHFFVVDVDNKPGSGESFAKLKLPPTLTAKTGGGGRHLWYGVQAHQMERLIAHGGQTNGRLGIGIDTRYLKGYLVSPPSVTTGTYEWINNTPVEPLPDHLFNVIINGRGKGLSNGAQRTPIEAPRSNDDDKKGEKLPRFEPIVTGCAFVDHCLRNRATLSEPYWFTGLSFAGACEDGDHWAHELSKDHPGYDPAATDKKLAHAREKPPRTCQNIQSELGFSGCKTCPFNSHREMRSPIALGYGDTEMAALQRKHIVDAETSRWLNVASGKISSRQAADNLLRWRLGKTPHVTHTGNRNTPQVDRLDYVVGDDRLIIPDGPEYLIGNIWRAGGVAPCDGDPSALILHFDLLISDEASRSHVLKYLGHLVQHPGVKITHALILSGAQGTGKSTLTKLMQRLFGDANVRSIGGEALLNRFKADLVNIQVACVEEANFGTRYEVANNLKTWFSEDDMPVEEKGVPIYRGRTPRGIIILSNYSAPLVIERADRRYFICRTTDTVQPPAYFDALYRAISDDATVGAFKQWLLGLDLSGFNPKAEPPRTAAREEAERDSLPPIAQELMEELDEGSLLFRHDLFEKRDVERFLETRTNLRTSVTKQKVKEALAKIGARKIGRVRTGTAVGQQHNLWAIRNHEHWAAQDHGALASAYKVILAAKGKPTP
jgi:hypothetical protein